MCSKIFKFFVKNNLFKIKIVHTYGENTAFCFKPWKILLV